MMSSPKHSFLVALFFSSRKLRRNASDRLELAVCALLAGILWGYDPHAADTHPFTTELSLVPTRASSVVGGLDGHVVGVERQVLISRAEVPPSLQEPIALAALDPVAPFSHLDLLFSPSFPNHDQDRYPARHHAQRDAIRAGLPSKLPFRLCYCQRLSLRSFLAS